RPKSGSPGVSKPRSAPPSTPPRWTTACSAPTQRLIAASRAPASRSVVLGTCAPSSSGRCRGMTIYAPLCLLQSVEGAGKHPVDDGIDGVSLAAFLRQIGSEDCRQRHTLMV